jgi:SAM-dependent methyltransferase
MLRLRLLLAATCARGALLAGARPAAAAAGQGGRRAPSPMAVGRLLQRYDPAADFPAEWPYDADDFGRMDESRDGLFYAAPRFVRHVDDAAIAALTAYYAAALPARADVLDLCSSWVSHLPPDAQLGRVAGLGLNAAELEANGRLTEWAQADLNADPALPYADASFDACLNAVSVDYLTRPHEVFTEMHRVLRPGGVAIMSFSNRFFATKAVAMWLANTDAGRRHIVASYFALSPPGGWEGIEAVDITGAAEAAAAAGSPLRLAVLWLKSATGDPMFVVRATKAR